MKHWAIKYIGLSHAEVGECWGLLQTVVRERLAVDMPQIVPGARASQEASIRAAVRGWHRRRGPFPLADEIVVMRGSAGPHVGFALHIDGWVKILHAKETREGVVCDRWIDMVTQGFSGFEFWSRDNAR
jgi:hypothetical protein